MEPFDALTEEDKEIFLKYLDYFADTTPTVPLSDLLRFWNTSKANIFHAFGENLTLRKRVHYTRTESQIKDDFENIYFALGTEADIARRNISDTLQLYACKVFLEGKSEYDFDRTKCSIPPEFYWLANFTSIFNLSTNIYESNTFYIPTPEGKKFKIQKGCHILPTLRKLCRIIGVPEETYEKVRLAQSRALNEADITGELCLSIAPIDFITMSDNACGWDSCMAWYSYTGEYRAGTIEMMNSPCVIVAYLNDPSPFYPFHSWGDKITTISNKRWRQLIIADKDVILGNRQYPFENNSLETAALNWVRELMQASGNSYEETTRDYYNGVIKDVVNSPRLSFSTRLMYNDIYGKRTMFLSTTFLNDYPTYFTLHFSGKSECMRCGEIIGSDSDTSWIQCGDCMGVKVCSNCGGYIFDYDYYEVNNYGEIFCSDCLNHSDSINHCEHCGEPFYENDLEYIEYIPIGGRYQHYVCACSDCTPNRSVFGPIDEDENAYKAENFDDEAIDFIESCGNVIEVE